MRKWCSTVTPEMGPGFQFFALWPPSLLWRSDQFTLTSSFFIFLASLGPPRPPAAAAGGGGGGAAWTAEGALGPEEGELGRRVSPPPPLTLLACDAEPGLRADRDRSFGDSEVRCNGQ